MVTPVMDATSLPVSIIGGKRMKKTKYENRTVSGTKFCLSFHLITKHHPAVLLSPELVNRLASRPENTAAPQSHQHPLHTSCARYTFIYRSVAGLCSLCLITEMRRRGRGGVFSSHECYFMFVFFISAHRHGETASVRVERESLRYLTDTKTQKKV